MRIKKCEVCGKPLPKENAAWETWCSACIAKADQQEMGDRHKEESKEMADFHMKVAKLQRQL